MKHCAELRELGDKHNILQESAKTNAIASPAVMLTSNVEEIYTYEPRLKCA